VLVLLLGCVFGRAEGTCPWLNVATAAGFLGGPVSLEMHSAGGDEMACIFRLTEGTTLRRLEISVQETTKTLVAVKAQCTSTPMPMKAIGNEAILCAADSSGLKREQVVGRVRDKIFMVKLSDRAERDPALLKKTMDNTVERIAEQVAGALF